MTARFAERRKALLERFSGAEIDTLLVTHPADWYYLTGFTGESGALVVTARGSTLITDGRFVGQAKAETDGVNVELQKPTLLEATGKFIAAQNGRTVGFDPTQLTVEQFGTVRSAARRAVGKSSAWKPLPGLIMSLRMRKDPQELAVMRRAAILAGQVMDGAISLLRAGVTEIEVAGEIEYQMRKHGASGPAFETIVAFGERSALPHARPTAKRLKKNELVVLDLGAILAHYCSDITRTFYFGKAPKRIRMWYQSVQDAQVAAIAAVKNGAACGDIDAAARQVLERSGLGQFFVHSTGHGLGIEVHEDPRVARGQKQRLEPGNVVTIEPGVYVQGVGGIRIEDDVAVHTDRAEVLTRIPRDLIEI
ncbi:MAG: Xaa-Pro peptidase family protein [Acidobacteriota bacterium]|nr:Xaa-Pro peptidase family protein [Acidobacteriota bacterium]